MFQGSCNLPTTVRQVRLAKKNKEVVDAVASIIKYVSSKPYNPIKGIDVVLDTTTKIYQHANN